MAANAHGVFDMAGMIGKFKEAIERKKGRKAKRKATIKPAKPPRTGGIKPAKPGVKATTKPRRGPLGKVARGVRSRAPEPEVLNPFSKYSDGMMGSSITKQQDMGSHGMARKGRFMNRGSDK